MECTIAMQSNALKSSVSACTCSQGHVVTSCMSEGDTIPRYTCASNAEPQYIPSQIRTARASVLPQKKH